MASWAYLLLALVAAASAAPEGRIVGGTQTSIEEFPYIVALVYTYPGPGITIQRCVGSLISSWHVLTSGFCFTGANNQNMLIRAGSTHSLSGGSVTTVRDVVKPDDYNETPRRSDIAVVFVRDPFGLSNVVDILFLPPQNTFIPDGHEVKVVSWGFEAIGGAQLEYLKYVFLNKISLEECQEIYAENNEVDIVDSVICAAAPGRGMCTGDSGAPMAITQVAVGLFSYFRDCDGTKPEVFTRVDRHTDWILSVAAAPSSDSPNIRSRPAVRR